MQKKCPDKQQNREEPPLSLGRDVPQPAPVERRAGEIIGSSNTSFTRPGAPAVINGRAGTVDERRNGLKRTEMTTLRTHFTFRVDTWTPDGESIVEHVAGVEDYQVALATYRAACQRWPGIPITLRQGARVIEDSRRLRVV